MKPLERVQKLIALAGSPNENESRNAAAEACRLIREHKLVVSEPGGASPPTSFPWDWFGFSPTPPPPPASPPPKPRRRKGVAKIVTDVFQEANARAAVEKLRPDLRRLAHDYSVGGTRELARIAEELGLTMEAAVLRRAAS